jgi:hypothetical protein
MTRATEKLTLTHHDENAGFVGKVRVAVTKVGGPKHLN